MQYSTSFMIAKAPYNSAEYAFLSMTVTEQMKLATPNFSLLEVMII